MRLQVAEAYIKRGALSRLLETTYDDDDAAIVDFTSVIETYSDDTYVLVRLQVAEAHIKRGCEHRLQGHLDAAIADYTSIIETYSAAQGRWGVGHSELSSPSCSIRCLRSVRDSPPSSQNWGPEILASGRW